jgi:hypothetical protein
MKRYITPAAIGGALVMFLGMPASGSAQELIVNGGFETGNLTGWTTTGHGTSGTCPSAPRDWNVGTSGGATGCSDPGAPPSGTFAAYNMFDGPSAMFYAMTQSFLVPTGLAAANLSWKDAAVWNVNGLPRTFSVFLLDGGMSVVATPFQFAASGGGSYAWTARAYDVTSVLQAYQGQMMSLQFHVAIPQTWTGPAGLGVDDVSLRVETQQVVPEPISMVLLGTGLVGIAAARRRRQRTARN